MIQPVGVWLQQCTPLAVQWDSKNWKEDLLALVNVGIYLFSLSVPNKTSPFFTWLLLFCGLDSGKQ